MYCTRLAEKYRMQKVTISAPLHDFVMLYLCNQGMYRQLEKNSLNSNISSRCPHNMANFGPLTAQIGLPVWGTPANFNRFGVLAALLQRLAHHRPTKLHDLWSSPELVHYIYIFSGLSPPAWILTRAKFTLCPSLAFSCIGSVTARHSSSGRQPNCGVIQGMELRNFHRGRHVYSAGRPSPWASAHILVMSKIRY